MAQTFCIKQMLLCCSQHPASKNLLTLKVFEYDCMTSSHPEIHRSIVIYVTPVVFHSSTTYGTEVDGLLAPPTGQKQKPMEE